MVNSHNKKKRKSVANKLQLGDVISTVLVIITTLFIISTLVYLSARYLGFEYSLEVGAFFTSITTTIILIGGYLIKALRNKSKFLGVFLLILISFALFGGYYVGSTLIHPLGKNGEFVFFGTPLTPSLSNQENVVTSGFISDFVVCSATVLNGNVVGGNANFNTMLNDPNIKTEYVLDGFIAIPFGIDGDINSINLDFIDNASLNPVDYVYLKSVKIYKLYPNILISNLTNLTLNKYHPLSGKFTAGEYVLYIQLSFYASETNSKLINENYTIFTIAGNTIPNNKIIFGYNLNLDVHNSSNFPDDNC